MYQQEQEIDSTTDNTSDTSSDDDSIYNQHISKKKSNKNSLVRATELSNHVVCSLTFFTYIETYL